MPKLLTTVVNKRIHRAATNGAAVYFPVFTENTPKSQIRGVDFDGKPFPSPVTQVDVDGYVHVLAADCDRVYFAARQDSPNPETMWQVPVKGGMAQMLPKPPGDEVVGVETIAVDDNKVFWTDYRGLGVWVKDSLDATRIAADAGFKGGGIAIEGKDLYWTEYQEMTMKGRIHQATILPMGIDVNSSFTEYDGLPGQLAVDGQNLYWIDISPTGQRAIQWLARKDIGVAVPQMLVVAPMGQTIGESIVVDTTDFYVYFIQSNLDGTNATTYRTNKPGGMTDAQPIAKQPFEEKWLIADAKRIYMVTPKNGDSPVVGQIDWVGR